MKKIQIVLTALPLFVFACGETKKSTGAAVPQTAGSVGYAGGENIRAEMDIVLEPAGPAGPTEADHRTLRTRTEFRGELANVFGLRQSDFDSVYTAVQDSLPSVETVSETTVNEGFLTSLAQMASRGCELYAAKTWPTATPAVTADQKIDEVLTLIYFDADRRLKAREHVMELANLVPAAVNPNLRYLIGCSVAAASKGFL